MKRVLAALLLAASGAASGAEAFAFALIGDTPYSRFERTWFADYLGEVTGDAVDFVIHVGDLKSGGEPCSDALYADRHALFDASRIPFVLVPGDNDWSDCNRLAAGRFDPLERLAALRARFYPPGESLGRQRMALASQADAGVLPFRENLRWQRGPVTFVTLNIVGPNNRRGQGETPPAEFVVRSAANLAWLDEAFALARSSGSQGVVVAIQADTGIERLARGAVREGFAGFVTRLREHVLAFDGEVLLAHGDGHLHEIDQPLEDHQGRRVARFTRIETHGSPFMGWTRVAVRPGATPLFSFQSRSYTPAPPGRISP